MVGYDIFSLVLNLQIYLLLLHEVATLFNFTAIIYCKKMTRAVLCGVK